MVSPDEPIEVTAGGWILTKTETGWTLRQIEGQEKASLPPTKYMDQLIKKYYTAIERTRKRGPEEVSHHAS